MKRDNYSVLVLNADYQPLNKAPLSTISWHEAMRLIYQEKAYPIEVYDDVIHTTTQTFPVPSVIVLASFKKLKQTARLSKENIKYRDLFRCGYCEVVHSKRSSTVDHIHPKSHGGKDTWENWITACKPCNNKKGNKLGIKPKFKAYKPTYYELAKNIAKCNGISEEMWRKYV